MEDYIPGGSYDTFGESGPLETRQSSRMILYRFQMSIHNRVECMDTQEHYS